MTQNKFWVLMSNKHNYKMRFNTQQEVCNMAKSQANEYKDDSFYVLEATHHYKADVNVIETSFEPTTEESLAVAEQDDLISIKPVLGLPKYKIGDEVLYEDLYKEDIVSNWQKGVVIDIIDNEYVKIKNKVTTEIFTYLFDSEYVKLAELIVDKTATVEPRLKIGDIVNHKHYGKCKIEQLNCFGSHEWYAVTNKESPEWFCIKEEKLTLAEPETLKREFKVGDRVKYKTKDCTGNAYRIGKIDSFIYPQRVCLMVGSYPKYFNTDEITHA